MTKAITTVGFFLSLSTVALAQMAPPPGAATHQGTKSVPSQAAMSKGMHSSKSMKKMKMKASPMPKMKSSAMPKQ
jgi:hypothetical protein